VVLVFGTRPEAIKLAPVYREMVQRRDHFDPRIWITSQHREMLDQVLETFALKVDRDFDLMRPGQTLAELTARVVTALQNPLERDPPDCILVQGDTTTMFATALAAFYVRVPVGHVEAGLRTGNKFAPFPEEMNRCLATRLCDYHFAPTEWARENLRADGIEADRIWVTGNTVIDALDMMVTKVRVESPVFPGSFPQAAFEHPGRVILITGHRRESFGEDFESICRAIVDLARRFPQDRFVYPVHLNPNVRDPVFRLLGGEPNIHLSEPLAYPAFVWAMDRSHLLLTDSGGVQEEAPHLGKPVLVMREVTERPEAIEAGTSKLVGVKSERIVGECSHLLESPEAYDRMSRAQNPYGDGRSSKRIANALLPLLRRV
jgi:UDP-N-acetylglucosamine 2-epimerase (non-hydrolysing)